MPAADATPEGWSHPAQLGPYAVDVLHYGSGTDLRRPHYRQVDAVSQSVDLSEHLSLSPARRLYWGLTAHTVPLNARVHMPRARTAGERFPLILMAHGSSSMTVDSELGYDYLGRHLASRGFIFVSLDMNFLNPIGLGPPTGAMEARARLFLHHLRQWRALDTTPGPFHGRLDHTRVVLAGHSRGGEAALAAAVLHEWKLSFLWQYGDLDDATGFVRAVVALAPTDGRYPWHGRRPASQSTSYLVVHGSHDGDVLAFEGLRSFARTRLLSKRLVKTAVFVHRANHGQWNTQWGERDHGISSSRILDLSRHLPGRQQRRLAEVLMAAFIEGTVLERPGSLRVFREPDVRDVWFPGLGLVTRYQDGRFLELAGFTEDERLTTGAIAGVSIGVHGADEWREGWLRFRARGWGHQHERVAEIAWRGRARLDVHLEPGVLDGVQDRSELHVALAAEKPAYATGWRIEVEDRAHQMASVALPDPDALRPPLPVRIFRDPVTEDETFAYPSDIILQSVIVPMRRLRAANPSLSLDQLQRISLILDSAERQRLYIDAIGVFL